MEPTPIRPLLARTLRGRCPVCGRGPLFAHLFTLRQFCPACGFRYHRAIEYGGEGYLSGAISLNVMLTGGVLAFVLIYLAATGQRPSLAAELAAGIAWTVIFPLLFHRLAIGIWVALDLRLNPPLEHELAAAPPRAGRDE